MLTINKTKVSSKLQTIVALGMVHRMMQTFRKNIAFIKVQELFQILFR